MSQILLHLSDSANSSFTWAFSHFMCSCCKGDLLAGMAPLHDNGNWWHQLKSPHAALLASASACLFSWIPSCPGVPLNSILIPLCLIITASNCSCTLSTK